MATVELKDLIDQGDVVGDMGFVIFYPHAPFSLTATPRWTRRRPHIRFFLVSGESDFFLRRCAPSRGKQSSREQLKHRPVVLTAAVDDEFDGLVKVFATVDVTVNGGDPQPLYQGNAWVGSRGAL